MTVEILTVIMNVVKGTGEIPKKCTHLVLVIGNALIVHGGAYRQMLVGDIVLCL